MANSTTGSRTIQLPGSIAPLILVADDDPMMRIGYRGALERGGFRVAEVENGVAALSEYAELHPAVVLLDVMMPVMDGFTTCSRLRADAAGANVPILIATSLDDVSSIERAYDVGATDFISKPINWQILVQRIRYMLRADDTLRRLHESERRLAEAQRIASLGNFAWRVGDCALNGSAELRRIFGLVRAGGSISLRDILRRLPSDERTNLLRSVREALQNNAPLHSDFALTSQEGSSANIDIRGEIVVDASGRTMIQGTVQDVSERKRTEAALDAARRAAEGADAAKTALLANMNHELRTPLNAIIGFSEIISGEILGPIGEHRYKEFASDILQCGRHMLELVTNVIEMAKLASNNYTLELESADLHAIAARAIALVLDAPFARQRSISFADWNFTDPVRVDVRAVTQMLVQLLGNAVRFSAPDTPVHVACGVRDAGDVWLTVRDQGIGMSAEEAEIAVEMFRQVDNRLERKFEGLGVGLSIVRKLMECHGGRLVIDSSPGEGASVSLVFPRNLIVDAGGTRPV